MKVTFNKNKNNKYLSQDRERKRRHKKGELELASTKVDSINHTVARNSHRNNTITVNELPKKKPKSKYHTNTVSTNVSHRRKSRRRSTNNSNGKSRNKSKSKKRVLIETTKSHILTKLMPRHSIWTKTNVTPLAGDCAPVKLVHNSEVTTDSEMKWIRKLHSLKYDLQKKENKIKLIKEKAKEEKKKYKKMLKDNKKKEFKKAENIDYLEYKIEEMRMNEEQLIDDLYHQQSIAKDAVRSLEALSKQYEEDKEKIKLEAESQYQNLLKKEVKVYSYKLDALKTVNETLTNRIQKYENQERLFVE